MPPERDHFAAYSFVDRIVEGTPLLLLRIPIVRAVVFGRVLFHEVGHHIHKVMRPEHREPEHVADDWARRLGRIHIRRRHAVARALLLPVRWTSRVLRRITVPERGARR